MVSFRLSYRKDGKTFMVHLPCESAQEAGDDAAGLLATGATSVEIEKISADHPIEHAVHATERPGGYGNDFPEIPEHESTLNSLRRQAEEDLRKFREVEIEWLGKTSMGTCQSDASDGLKIAYADRRQAAMNAVQRLAAGELHYTKVHAEFIAWVDANTTVMAPETMVTQSHILFPPSRGIPPQR